MHLCYIDESGTLDVPGNTSHYVLARISVPDQFWKSHQTQLDQIKRNFGLENDEIHVAWMMTAYFEQRQINDFETMTAARRRSWVQKNVSVFLWPRSKSWLRTCSIEPTETTRLKESCNAVRVVLR